MLTAMTYSGLTAEPALRIFTPPEHATVHSERVYIVGQTSSDSVELFVNGVSIGSVPVRDSMFHKLVEFGYGINEITVVARELSDDGVSVGRLEKVEALYAPTSNERFEKMYERYEFHGSDIESECVDCHNLDLSAGDTEKAKKSCLKCHTALAESFQSHAKAESGACVTCHVKSGEMTRTRSKTENLCFTCHPERRGLFSQEYIHGPVAGGSCICHNPHGSNYEKSLVRPVQLLCFSCHENLEERMDDLVVHRPFERGDCVECHDPHASSNKWALVKTSEEVCLKCHDPENGFDHNHPYNVRPQSKLNVPLKLTPRGQLECLSCHSPHSSSAEHLLRITSDFICAGCHQEKM